MGMVGQPLGGGDNVTNDSAKILWLAGRTNTEIIARSAVFNQGGFNTYEAMAVNECVDAILHRLGKQEVTTVGWRARLYVFIRTFLPRALSRFLLDSSIESALQSRLTYEVKSRSD